jgi:hypothetical protein
MDRFGIDVLQACQTVKGASALIGISCDQAWHVLERAVARGLSRKEAVEISRSWPSSEGTVATEPRPTSRPSSTSTAVGYGFTHEDLGGTVFLTICPRPFWGVVIWGAQSMGGESMLFGGASGAPASRGQRDLVLGSPIPEAARRSEHGSSDTGRHLACQKTS